MATKKISTGSKKIKKETASQDLAWQAGIDAWNNEIDKINAYLNQNNIQKKIDTLTIQGIKKGGYTWPDIVNNSQPYEYDQELSSLTDVYLELLRRNDITGISQIENLINTHKPQEDDPYWMSGMLWSRLYEPGSEKILKRFPDTNLDSIYSNDSDAVLHLYLRLLACYTPKDLPEHKERIQDIIQNINNELDSQNSKWEDITPRIITKAFNAYMALNSISSLEPIKASSELIEKLSLYPRSILLQWTHALDTSSFLTEFDLFTFDTDDIFQKACVIDSEQYLTYCLLKAWDDDEEEKLFYLLTNMPEIFPEMTTWKTFDLWTEAAHEVHARMILDSVLIEYPKLSSKLMIAKSLDTISIIANEVLHGTYSTKKNTNTSLDLPSMD